jgi:hypothetical protein
LHKLKGAQQKLIKGRPISKKVPSKMKPQLTHGKVRHISVKPKAKKTHTPKKAKKR